MPDSSGNASIQWIPVLTSLDRELPRLAAVFDAEFKGAIRFDGHPGSSRGGCRRFGEQRGRVAVEPESLAAATAWLSNLQVRRLCGASGVRPIPYSMKYKMGTMPVQPTKSPFAGFPG